MTINDDKTVAAVAAPVTSKEVKEKIKRSKKQKQPIFDSTFSFTDDKMARATCKMELNNLTEDMMKRFQVFVCIYSRVV